MAFSSSTYHSTEFPLLTKCLLELCSFRGVDTFTIAAALVCVHKCVLMTRCASFLFFFLKIFKIWLHLNHFVCIYSM